MTDARHECVWWSSHSDFRPAFLVRVSRHFPDGRTAVAKTLVPYEEAAGRLSFRTLRQLLRGQRYVATRTIDMPDEGTLF